MEREAQDAIRKAYFKMLREIKEYYLSNINAILQHHKERPDTLFEAYPFDWNYVLNEVEWLAWTTTRNKGYLPLYPQFPVKKYFLDFANPGVKIGIEIDGIEYHEYDKDYDRDTDLKKEGWTIIRIPAAQMVNENFSSSWGNLEHYNHKWDLIPDTILNDITYWMMGTGDGVLEAIKVIYFDGKVNTPSNYENWYRELCRRSINSHIIIR